MAFWGTEVKPGKPFTQKFDDFKGRLHVSLATLGFGTATKKSVLQCNVGNKSPVYLCSLFPEKAECLQLNLEYEEADEVIFSVIGPRSIHLSGYFLGSCCHNNVNDDNTESYGEDIANTETQSSEYADEDKYEDSFINDEDPEVFSPSPISNEEDETFGNKNRNKARNCRRLRKSYQLSESDEDYEENSQLKNIVKSGTPFSELESLDEDNHPISSLCNNRTKGENATATKEKEAIEHKVLHESSDLKTEFDGDFDIGVNENTDGIIDDGQLNGELDLPINSSEVSTKVGRKRKKKQKGERSKRKFVEADGNSCSTTSGVEIQQNESKMDNTVNTVSEGKQETITGVELLDNLSVPSADVVHDGERPKKKKKKGSEQGKIIENNGKCDRKPDKMDQDVQPTFDQTENQPITKKIAKKKMTKAIENGDSLKSDISLSSAGAEKPTTEIEDKEINVVSKSSQARTLPSGLVIEELEAGKPNGKVATSKRKISVLYVGKLKQSGEIVDSTKDKPPYKFRLGTGQVIEGWDAGLDGMRVGEKRRLTIPPSMGYGNEGDGGNIPPDSWLVYDVELVKVH